MRKDYVQTRSCSNASFLLLHFLSLRRRSARSMSPTDNKEFKLDMEKTSQGEKATGCSVSGELEVRMITSFNLRFFYPGLLTLFNVTSAR
jgi:hypothetical protein